MKTILSLLLITIGFTSKALENPCPTVSSLIINTGLQFTNNNPNGVLLQPTTTDPNWKITSISNIVQPYLSTPPYAASIITVPVSWNSSSTNSRWIVPLLSGYYSTSASNPSNGAWVVFSREFKVCKADTFKFQLECLNDDELVEISIDNIAISHPNLPQPTIYPATTYYTTYGSFNFTKFLPVGTHKISFKVINYNTESNFGNYNGLQVKGTISSIGNQNTLVSNIALPNCNCVSTSIKNISEEDDFQFGPNPANEILIVKSKFAGELFISNAFGQIIKTEFISNSKNGHRINIHSLPMGVYMINFKNDKGQFSKKFIKQ